MANNIEILPVVNVAGEVIGSAPRSECHDGKSFLLHPVVHLHVYNPRKGLLLQKRSLKKKIQPGKWDTAVGGHVDYGEKISEALKREVREEIGIGLPSDTELVRVYEFRSSVERELIYSHIAIIDGDIDLYISEPDDIDSLEFIPLAEISEDRSELFTPNFVQEFKDVVLPYILKNGITDNK